MKKISIACLILLCSIYSTGLAQAQFGGGGCRPVTYSGITPDRFECMKQGLQDYGISVPSGESGEISGNGITANFEWDGRSKLTITVTEKPFFAGCGTITDRVRQFAQDCE